MILTLERRAHLVFGKIVYPSVSHRCNLVRAHYHAGATSFGTKEQGVNGALSQVFVQSVPDRHSL